jgi:sigma-B regulation protein RsbU (phosphoserine phosphatase)
MDATPDIPSGRSARRSTVALEQVFDSNEAASTRRRMRSALGRQLFEYGLEESSARPKPVTGRVLIVDHDQLSGGILARNLQRDGYAVEREESGPRALARLGEGGFDMVLWEVGLPTLKGFDLLAQIKQDARLQHLPVVLLSERNDIDAVVRCIEAGAEDYLFKPFNPALLKARIRACLERKVLREQEQRLLATIKTQQQRLDEELKEAADYLQSLLPAPFSEPFTVKWRFIPWSELGGDSFGYHWIDDDHFALYLLDVCGHGVGAALLSVAALNVLRSGAMQGIDSRSPGAVLSAMNRAFPMEKQNDRYFTLWYGVYQPSNRKLTYGSAGHPAAILHETGVAAPKKLLARGMLIGGMPDSRYPEQTCEIAPGSRFFLFSDGAYEVTLEDGSVFSLDEFIPMLGALPADAPVDLDALIAQIRAQRRGLPFEDDLSIVSIEFK